MVVSVVLRLLVTAVGLRSVGFGATHFSLDKSRMGGDTFQPKNPTFLKPTVTSRALVLSIVHLVQSNYRFLLREQFLYLRKD